MARTTRKIAIGVAWVVGIFGAMQVVPYGRTHGNPATTAEPHWDSPHTRELAVRACFDCHSNETRWPWYADVAPFSWVVERDVEAARTVINFSEWDRTYPLTDYCGESVKLGNMPPLKYQAAHPESRLTPEETDALAHGFDATLKDPHARF